MYSEIFFSKGLKNSVSWLFHLENKLNNLLSRGQLWKGDDQGPIGAWGAGVEGATKHIENSHFSIQSLS